MLLAFREFKEIKVRRALLGRLESKEFRAHRVLPDQRDLKVEQVVQDLKEIKALRVRQEPPESRAHRVVLE